jgi:glycosyltransferase involved in cell wall biosynthesis
MHDVVLTMPVFNEAEGIETFLEEIFLAFDNAINIIVCDDSSKDLTHSILISITEQRENLHVIQNSRNLGHGATFLNALKVGLEFKGPKYLITCDGDGQFSGKEIYRIYAACKEKEIQVLEGVRKSRTDGALRATISFFTRVFVWVLTGNFPEDANTPLRVYQKNAIDTLYEVIPNRSLVPNLWFSIFVRAHKYNFIQSGVESRPRLGVSTSGSTWQGMSKFKKLKRLFEFCWNATWEISYNFSKLSTKKE